ncbi:chemotaxis-specific protein-glutamate methyltransferase CheB [Sporichthya polymorpha]|uniref:chemotaxis-specific protein-glutamate methyltransferase CheB n=1 Tax=Sporichthya polymorpha TaxID=35751 RepID=UPI0003805F64|nr:chemotaxis-specific protein-glutamate methyltransferase CheB [Sporichthya polymorpha]
MPPIRVLVVDDTVVVRRLVADVIAGAEGIEVVGTAAHGQLALDQIPVCKPDVVTLDVEMPVMDGLTTLAEIRKRWPKLPVIMFSTLTSRGASATLDALALGANDYVTKPTALRDREAALAAVRSSLVPLLKLWGRVGAADARRAAAGPTAAPAPDLTVLPATPAQRRPELDGRPPLGVVIGVSTGGPVALSTVVPALPVDLGVPVVIVQHMPPVFTKLLAERLDAASALDVVEAADLMPLTPGRVYIAAGGFHLTMTTVRGMQVLRLDDGPMENSCKPAVDVTLRHAKALWGPRTLTVILTGMGSDGLAGARDLRAAGGRVIAQDAETSVVWGMPGAVAKAGVADAVLPLARIAPTIVDAVRGARPAVPTAAGGIR